MQSLKSMLPRIGATLFLLSVTGCTPLLVAKYQEPTSGETAEVRFPNPAEFSPLVLKKPDCIDFASGWYERGEGQRTDRLKVAANVPLHLNYTFQTYNTMCAINFQFTPDPGQTYVVMGSSNTNTNQTFGEKLFNRNLGSCSVAAGVVKGKAIERIELKRLHVSDRFRLFAGQDRCLIVKDPEAESP